MQFEFSRLQFFINQSTIISMDCQHFLRCNAIHLIKQLQFTKKQMDFQQFTLKPQKNIVRHISQNESLRLKQQNPIDTHFRFSEPKDRGNFIKINKNKLPNDFFQKRQNRRVSEQKIYLPQQQTQPVIHSKRVQSERLIYSPDKTSFFGFLEEKAIQIPQKLSVQPSKLLNRKFQTRQEPKRSTIDVQISRKVTGTSKTSKRDLLGLFPPTFDEKMNDFVNESSKNHFERMAPKRQLAPISRQAQLFINPQKNQPNEFIFPFARKHKQMVVKLTNMSFMDNENAESMNITFYNAKSNCLPPINRQHA